MLACIKYCAVLYHGNTKLNLCVGLTWEEAKTRCPPGVLPACHNAEDTVTISGPAAAVSSYVKQLQSEGIFAKDVNSAGVAFHSSYMADIAPSLLAALEKVT